MCAPLVAYVLLRVDLVFLVHVFRCRNRRYSGFLRPFPSGIISRWKSGPQHGFLPYRPLEKKLNLINWNWLLLRHWLQNTDTPPRPAAVCLQCIDAGRGEQPKIYACRVTAIVLTTRFAT